MTGWPFRDHLPYQNGPVARWRMKGRALGLGVINRRFAAYPSRQIARKYKNETARSGLLRRRSRVRVPSLPLKKCLETGTSCVNGPSPPDLRRRQGAHPLRARPDRENTRERDPVGRGRGTTGPSEDPRGGTARSRGSPCFGEPAFLRQSHAGQRRLRRTRRSLSALGGGPPDLEYSGLWARDAVRSSSSPDPRAQTTDEAIVSWVPPPQLVEQVEREEREARLRSAAAPEQAQGDTPSEHHALIHKLETEWRHALERLHRTRHAAQD